MELQTQNQSLVNQQNSLDEWLKAIPHLKLENLGQQLQLWEAFTPAVRRCEVLRMLIDAIEHGLKDLKEFKDPSDGIPVVLAECPHCGAFLGTLPLVTVDGDSGEWEPIDLSILDKAVSRWWNESNFTCPTCKIEFERLSDGEESESGADSAAEN